MLMPARISSGAYEFVVFEYVGLALMALPILALTDSGAAIDRRPWCAH
jgi:hypothetical protein